MAMLLVFSTLRIGEASNPGPQFHGPVAEWHVSTLNPTGLAGKEVLISSLPPGIHNVSESHLTEAGLRKFRAGLKYHGSHIQNVIHGAHPPLRAHSTSVAKHSGAALLSSVPCRKLNVDWPPEASFVQDPCSRCFAWGCVGARCHSPR